MPSFTLEFLMLSVWTRLICTFQGHYFDFYVHRLTELLKMRAIASFAARINRFKKRDLLKIDFNIN